MAFIDSNEYRRISAPLNESDYDNGLFWEKSTGDVVVVVDSVVHGRWSSNAADEESVSSARRCVLFEDFVGTMQIPDQASLGEAGPWATKNTVGAGAVVRSILGDGTNGALKLGFSANDTNQIVTLYWKDEQSIPPDGAGVFTCRLKPSATLAATETLVFGLASAQNDSFDDVATNAWFRIEGANLDLLVETDSAGGTDDDDNDTGVNVSATNYTEFKIDCTDPASVKFYYRTTLAGSWTRLLPNETFTISTNAVGLQPFVQFYKSGGAQTTYVLLDYVKVAWNRI